MTENEAKLSDLLRTATGLLHRAKPMIPVEWNDGRCRGDDEGGIALRGEIGAFLIGVTSACLCQHGRTGVCPHCVGL